MEPTSFRRVASVLQFDIRPDPNLVFDDYLENLSSGLNQTLFFHFVEKFKGIRSFNPADRKIAGQQLFEVLRAYFKGAGPHIDSLCLQPSEYRSIAIDLLMTVMIVSGEENLDKKAILELIHQMVQAYGTNREALFNAIGRQLNIGRSWEKEGFEFLYNHYLSTSQPREALYEELSLYVQSFSYLFWPEREEFIIKYIAYHLLENKHETSEYLDYLLIAAFSNKMARQRYPANPDLTKAFIVVFTSSQFVNMIPDAALYHFQKSHIFFELPSDVTFAQCESLLDNANKEFIKRVGFTEEQRTKIKVFSPQTLPHFVSTKQLEELITCFVNPRLKWEREAFGRINKEKLMKLFQRNILVEPEAFSYKLASVSSLFFQTLILKTQEFCDAFSLDQQKVMDHINCELFAGTCTHLQKNILWNVPMPVTCDPRGVLQQRIKASLVNQKIFETLSHLFKKIQEVDPMIHARHKGRLAQKIRGLNHKTILIGSEPYILRINESEITIEKKTFSRP